MVNPGNFFFGEVKHWKVNDAARPTDPQHFAGASQ